MPEGDGLGATPQPLNVESSVWPKGQIMDLQDGLNQYMSTTTYYTWALRLEKEAVQVLNLIHKYGCSPSKSALQEVHHFLVEIEKWKAGCLQQRMGNASKNTDSQIWDAIHSATKSTNDIQTLLEIMNLKGFGSSRDDVTGQKRAKVATSVLRFLWPEKWGVIDWRVAAMLGFLKKNKWNVENALDEAGQRPAKDFREAFNIIDEKGASEYIKEYRKICNQHISTLPRAADVDMAIFGLSLLAWPMP